MGWRRREGCGKLVCEIGKRRRVVAAAVEPAAAVVAGSSRLVELGKGSSDAMLKREREL